MQIDSFIAKTKRQKIFQSYWYIKQIYSRGNTYLSIPLGVAGSYMMFSLWLKLYLGVNNQILIYSIAVLILIILLFIGYLDVKNQICNEENSFGNRFNPEIQFIKSKLEENGKK